MTTAIKSISVSLEFASLADDNKISWSEAARVGMSLLLSEKGITEYDNNINAIRKIQLLQSKLSETSEELFKLKEKYEK